MRVRLRQVALITDDLKTDLERLSHELDLHVSHVDDTMATWGLSHGVLPVGAEFLELVQPIADGTSARRFLDRRGPGGYLLVLQVDDLDRALELVARRGVRVTASFEEPDWRSVQLHPTDMHGLFVTLDACSSFDEFPPNGVVDHAAHGSALADGITAAVVAAPDPAALASDLASILELESDGNTLVLDHGSLCFLPGDPDDPARVVELELSAPRSSTSTTARICHTAIRTSR